MYMNVRLIEIIHMLLLLYYLIFNSVIHLQDVRSESEKKDSRDLDLEQIY